MSSIPILDLSLSSDPLHRQDLLAQLHDALFNVGFLYVRNHGIAQETIDDLINILPRLFALPAENKLQISKLKSPHFLGYNGYAEESTLGKKDLREQFDFATDLPVIYDPDNKATKEGRDYSNLYWRLRGPNQWPNDNVLPHFQEIVTRYHDAVSQLSYWFVHLVEEAFSIPVGTFDHLFTRTGTHDHQPMPAQHRIKLLHYPPVPISEASTQGVGPHKDSSGWLTFLYQPPHPEGGLYVLSRSGSWLSVPPISSTFVVNIGNAFEAATEGAIRATIHKVDAPRTQARYSVPFFMGLPLDLTVSQICQLMPEEVKKLGRDRKVKNRNDGVSMFLDPRWDSLGESQLRKWIRSHEDVGDRWYGNEVCKYYLS